ncbi:MAG: HNH endonuclease, partial [Gammaproteobacteria bacterium]|nr:HNH endonuclease [Gammaproteobacteria bacterium]MCW8973728.1 HNH endonuclease [Gammaproteobacteria bacterium]
DAAAVNSTRWALLTALKRTGLPVETGTGGRTKWNRQRLGIPKGHALDAACVGKVDSVEGWERPVLSIKAAGRGSYQRTRLTRHGFPRGYLMRKKQVQGFQTGDHVRAMVPSGKKVGMYTGRVAVRASGSFNIQTPAGVIQGISHRHCQLPQRADGYGYSVQPKIATTEMEEARTRAA